MTKPFQRIGRYVREHVPMADRILASLYLIIGFIVSFACLHLFAEIAEEVISEDELVLFDQMLADALHVSVSQTQVQAFAFITLFGSQIVALIAVMGGLYYVIKRQWTRLVVWLVAIAGGELLNLALKSLFSRPRPSFDISFATAVNASFPSGHAMLSLITYGLLTYLAFQIIHNLRARILIAGIAILLVTAICLSRLVLGVHYISDVVAGMAVGGMWLSACIVALEFVRRRKPRTSPQTTI